MAPNSRQPGCEGESIIAPPTWQPYTSRAEPGSSTFADAGAQSWETTGLSADTTGLNWHGAAGGKTFLHLSSILAHSSK